jgi:hypothetical protein
LTKQSVCRLRQRNQEANGRAGAGTKSKTVVARFRTKEKGREEHPQVLTELKSTKPPGLDPMGETVWRYPGGKAGMKCEVSSSSPRQSPLSPVEWSGLLIPKVQVTITDEESKDTNY